MKCFVLLALAAGLLGAADNPGSDGERLQGTWTCIRAEKRGEQHPQDGLAASRVQFTFDGSDFTMTAGGKIAKKGAFELAPGDIPGWINLTGSGLRDGITPAIYELEGDTLKICLGNIQEGRPLQFDTAPGSYRELLIFERAKTLD